MTRGALQGTQFKSALDTSGNAVSLPPKAAHTTYEQYLDNPATQDDFKKNLFAGSDIITVGNAKSLRPYEVKINRKYYNDITDPRMKHVANTLIQHERSNQLVRKASDAGYFNISTDQKEENIWRFNQIAAAEARGDKLGASKIRSWFAMIDGTLPMDEAYRNVIPVPDPEIP